MEAAEGFASHKNLSCWHSTDYPGQGGITTNKVCIDCVEKCKSKPKFLLNLHILSFNVIFLNQVDKKLIEGAKRLNTNVPDSKWDFTIFSFSSAFLLVPGIIRTFSTSLLFTGKLSRNWKRLFSLTWTWTFMVSDFEGLWRGQKHAMKRKQNWIDVEKFCIYFTLLFKKVTFSCCGTNFLNSMILRFSIFFT